MNQDMQIDAPADEGASVAHLVAAVRKRLALVGIITVIAVVGTAFYTLGQPKIYQTRATVLIDPNPPRPLGKDLNGALEVGASVYWSNREYYETQLQLITSRRLATLTVRQLGLNRDPAFLANLPMSNGNGPEVDVQVAATVLQKRLSVDPVKNTRLVEVTIEDASPERARRILSTHLDTYIRKNVDDAVTDTGSAADWMRDQLEKLRAELDQHELALHDYKKENGILSVNLDEQTNLFRDEIGQLSTAVTQARADREKIAARVAELGKVDTSDPEHLPIAELLNNGVISSLRQRYIDAKQEREALMAVGKGEQHPEVVKLTTRMKELRDAVVAEINNVQQSLTTDLDSSGKQAAGLAKLVGDAKQRALDLNMLEIDYRRLDRSRQNTERLFNLVLERSKDIDVTSQMRFNNIRVIDPPLTPRSPVRPNVPMNMAGGLLAGLVLGIAAAIGREQLDRTIKSPDDTAPLGLTYLGFLPRIDGGIGGDYAPYGRRKGRRKPANLSEGNVVPELMVHYAPHSAIAEAARSIRTNILFMSPDVPYRRLLVTSAVPSEGKTTVACSIGIAMAQAGQRVALIDCDLRRPRMHRIFGKQNQEGLTTVLLDPDSLDQVLSPTDVPGLQVLTSGPVPPNPAELLHSEAFARVLQDLEKRFDRVIFDSPPLIPVTDAAVLSTRVDATVLVVKPFMTRKEVARHAVRSLRDVGGRILGTVLNDLDLSRRDATYYYQYHSKYYRAYRQDPPASPPEGGQPGPSA